MDTSAVKPKTSKMRKFYFAKLIFRCICLLFFVGIFIYCPQQMDVLQDFNFFKTPSVLHIIWIIWVADMLIQIRPFTGKMPMGSKKLFSRNYLPADDAIDFRRLRTYILDTTLRAYRIFIGWVIGLAVIGILYYTGVLKDNHLFLITMLLYVADLVCVLIFCPFRLLVKAKCCTTCRIYNWDHLMMMSPLIFIGGFYCVSLLILAFTCWLLWEVSVMLYPERFWEQSNEALRCSNCKDKICTQFCNRQKHMK